MHISWIQQPGVPIDQMEDVLESRKSWKYGSYGVANIRNPDIRGPDVSSFFFCPSHTTDVAVTRVGHGRVVVGNVSIHGFERFDLLEGIPYVVIRGIHYYLDDDTLRFIFVPQTKILGYKLGRLLSPPIIDWSVQSLIETAREVDPPPKPCYVPRQNTPDLIYQLNDIPTDISAMR